MFRPAAFSQGFTLIELLIATSISLLLVGGGIASFVTFNDKQGLIGAGKELLSYIRSAQVKARAAERPEDCIKLDGYSIQGFADSATIRLVAICDGGVEYERSVYTLPSGTTSESDFDMMFLGLQGGVVGNEDVVLVSPSGDEYGISVSSSGEISDQGILPEQ